MDLKSFAGMNHKFTNHPSRLPAPPKLFFSLFLGGDVSVIDQSLSLGAIPRNLNILKLTSIWMI